MTEAQETTGQSQGRGRKRADGENVFARLNRFARETVAELRRVVWPTRQQVTTYTGVVLVFVVLMALLVALIDVAAGRGVLFIFGN